MTFWFAAGALLLVVSATLIWVGLRATATPKDSAATDYFQGNDEVLALDAQLGDVAVDQVAALKRDVARVTLNETNAHALKITPTARGERVAIALVLAVVIPAIAVPTYLKFGTLESIAPPVAADARPHPSLERMIAELQARITRAPDDPEPRLWLARVYMSSNQFDKAVQEFETLHKKNPDLPAVLVQYADALAMTNNGKLAGKATGLITHALELEPENPTALWLAGLAADEAGDAKKALVFLTHAKRASAASELPTAELDALIAEIENRSGEKSAPALAANIPAPAAATADATNAARVTVDVALDESLRATAPPDAILFVLAKAVNGPPMPLAVKRLTARDLPTHVILDDSLAMAPQFKLSSVNEVMVTARISKSGQPIAASGDLQGTAGPLKVGPATTVAIIINQVVP
ncbi:MAG: c-type cytochrome biogenesis protein CcmI [Gammaproteobacteria bacterium]|nr:c-type cytochrome biogenesis protein CcmI [Gammaproteobacteria bacterium]